MQFLHSKSEENISTWPHIHLLLGEKKYQHQVIKKEKEIMNRRERLRQQFAAVYFSKQANLTQQHIALFKPSNSLFPG